MRRILTIIAVLIVILGIAAGIYFFFFANKGASLTVGGSAVQNPFGGVGSGTSTNTGVDTGTSGEADFTDTGTTAVAAQPAPRLVEISAGPVADGMAAVRVAVPPPAVVDASGSSTAPLSGTTTDTEIRYIERASGNVYAYRVHGNVLTRISNRTIPGVQDASWLADGSMAYVRYITTDADGTMHVEGYALPSTGVGGFALPRDLAQATAAGSSTLFTLAAGTNGSIGTLAKADGTGGSTAFSSLLGQITAFYSKGGLFAMTKPSASVAGYAFSVDGSGSFVRALGPLNALSILPNHAGTKLLVSYLDGGTLRLASYDLASKQLTALPVSTLAEKCAWTADDLSAYCGVPVSLPSGKLPDDWYQGAVSFSDRIWKIDFDSRVAELVANLPTLAKTDIDAVSLTLDPTEDVLSFVNKRDGSLWSYDL
jgi:hypothetical protein